MNAVEPPHRIRFADEAKTQLALDWRDGHESVYPLTYLRGWCPCAVCQGHEAEHRFVPGPAEIAGMEPVGHYAISFQWSDGHSTGIYPWDRLREWCPCADCGGPRPGTPSDVA